MPDYVTRDDLEQLSAYLGAEIQRMVDRAVEERMSAVVLARVALVATTAQLGSSPFGTQTGPGGITQNTAKVWLDDSAGGGAPVKLPVRPGVTLTDGQQVRVERNYLRGTWASGRIDGPV